MTEGADALDRDGNDAALGALLLLAGLIAVPIGARVTWSNLRSGLVGRAIMIVSNSKLTIVHKGIFRKPEILDRSMISLASFDDRPAPLKRFRDHPRFHLATTQAHTTGSGHPEWLYSRVTGAPFPIISQVGDVPNLVLIFERPIRFATPRRFVKAFPSKQLLPPPLHKRAARGMLVRVTDPETARAAFGAWGVVRPLLLNDLLAAMPHEEHDREARRLLLRDNVALSAIILGQFALPVVLGAGEGGGPTSETFVALGMICDPTLRDVPPGPNEEEGLGDLLLDDPGEGLELFFDSPIDAEDAATFAPDDVEGWEERLVVAGYETGFARRWSARGTVVFTSVWRFPTPEDATSFERFARQDQCPFLHDAFQVPGIEGAVGMTFDVGGASLDEVSFVRGRYRFLVGVQTSEPQADHSRSLELSRRAAVALRLRS